MLPTMSTAPALAPCGGGGLGRRPSPRGVAGHGARWPKKSSRPNRSPGLGPAADTGVASAESPMPGDPIPLGLRPSRTSPQGRGGSGELMRKSKPGRSFHMLQAPSARRRIGSGAASGRSPAPLRSRSGPAPMTQQSASAPSGSPASGKMPPSPAARTKLLLEGPVLPTLLRLAAPNVLNLLAFVGVITFDGFFLGRIGTDALAGASLAFPWVMLVLQTTNSGMGAGVSSRGDP